MNPPPADDRLLANRLTAVAPPVVVVAPDAPHSPRTTSRVWPEVVALVLLGLVLRAGAVTSDRCLWIDEAMLALNLLDRTPARLLEPLDWNQGAPVGFLLLSKAALSLFGPAEWALRLVPFVGSVLGLVGFAWVAGRLFPRGPSALAVGLYAVSPFLISYAGECKQYQTDATTAVGLFAAALGLLRGESGTRKWAVLALAGAAAVWFSHPAVFVLAGVGTALLADAAWDRDRPRLAAAGVTVGCWLASFAACYVVCLRHLGTNKYLLDYWAGHFLPLGAGGAGWLVDHYFNFFGYPGGLGGSEIKAGGIAATLAAAGLWRLGEKCWPLAAALALPAGAALLASAVHRYPFAGRLLLFLVPAAVLLVAAGAGWLAEFAHSGGKVVVALLVGVLVAAPVLEASQEMRRPARSEQLAPVMTAVRDRWKPGDTVYVYYGAEPAFRFYSRKTPFPADAIVWGADHRGGGYADELKGLAGRGRVWVVFSHRHKNEEGTMRGQLDMLGRCVAAVERPGAAAYLYDLK